MLRRHLAGLLAERHPGRHGARLAMAVELMVPLVHPLPGSGWGGWGTRPAIQVAEAESWIGAPMEREARRAQLVRRYLAAFGPATVRDVQSWAGITRLREVIEDMRGELRVHRGEEGGELFDLPDAEPADPGLPVPVRFLPAYDNALLGHADRRRIIGEGERRMVMPGRALVLPTFLVDGFVRGTWRVADDALVVAPFRPVPAPVPDEVWEEAERLRAFLGAQRTTVEWAGADG
jgi:hypothetical protein